VHLKLQQGEAREGGCLQPKLDEARAEPQGLENGDVGVKRFRRLRGDSGWLGHSTLFYERRPANQM
jgi:hypothetical protein